MVKVECCTKTVKVKQWKRQRGSVFISVSKRQMGFPVRDSVSWDSHNCVLAFPGILGLSLGLGDDTLFYLSCLFQVPLWLHNIFFRCRGLMCWVKPQIWKLGEIGETTVEIFHNTWCKWIGKIHLSYWYWVVSPATSLKARVSPETAGWWFFSHYTVICQKQNIKVM